MTFSYRYNIYCVFYPGLVLEAQKRKGPHGLFILFLEVPYITVTHWKIIQLLFDGEILIGVSVMVSLSDRIIQTLYKITSSISQKIYTHTKVFAFIWKVTLQYYRALVRPGAWAQTLWVVSTQDSRGLDVISWHWRTDIIDLKAVLTKKMSEPSLGRERIKWQDIFVVGLNII